MACQLERPEFTTEVAAHDQAAQHRSDGAQYVEVFRCPLGDENHWHVATRPDDPILPLAHARAEMRRRSESMKESWRSSH